MNEPEFNRLAQRTVADPAFLSKAEAMALRELLFEYSQGVLDDESNREVESLIKANPKAATIHAELTATDKFLSSKEGKELVARSKDETRAKLDAIIGSSEKAKSPVSRVADIVSAIPPPFKLLDAPTGAAATITHLPPAASLFKGLSLVISEYRSANRRTIAKVAGETLTIQDFSNPAGYPLETRYGEIRFYCNFREHNGTSDVSFAVRLPDAVSSVCIRWERQFTGTDRPPEFCDLTFTSSAPRVELPVMERPADTERWCFECID